MYGVTQPLSYNYLGNNGAVRPSRGIPGDPGVHYDEGGRLVYPGQQPDAARGPVNRLLWRGGDPTQVSAPNNFRYRPWNRSVVTDPSAGPIFGRRIDGARAVPAGRPFYQPPVIEELPYTPAGRLAGLSVAPIGAVDATTTPGRTFVKTTMIPETIIIEERRVYDDKPCCFWLHLVVGILMIGVGVTNVVVCFDRLYYCFLWTGVAIFIFAIVCRIHGGDYIEKKWKSQLLIFVGFVATALESACVWFVIVAFIYHAISLAEVGPTDYVTTWKFRYGYYNLTPLVTVNNDYAYNLFICFALNGFQIVLLALSFFVLSTTLIVIDRFYNSYYVITRRVEPFCDPWLFNPWGQCSLGQAMIFVGTVVGATEHGNEINNWFLQYSPVWAGVFPIFAGIAAAIALKSCDSNRRWEQWLAVGLEVLSLVASLASIILMLLTLTDNIVSLTSSGGGVMLNTQWDRQLITASVISKGIGIIVSTVNLFYSATLIFRILVCICSNLYKDTDESDGKKLVLDESTENILFDKTGRSAAQLRDAMITTSATTYNTNDANLPIFRAYRPMGARSFYA